METDGRIDPELIYWIPKYILMRKDKPFSQLRYMSQKMRSCGKPGQNWMEKFYGGVHPIPLLQYPAVSSIDVQ